jgi:hypothetical protein
LDDRFRIDEQNSKLTKTTAARDPLSGHRGEEAARGLVVAELSFLVASAL